MVLLVHYSGEINLKSEIVINSDVQSKKVRLVNFPDKGVMSIHDALRFANQEQQTDLIELSVQEDVSICKVMPYDKFVFEQQKLEDERQKKSRKSQKQNELKEYRLRSEITDHDLMTKINQAQSNLEKGYGVVWVFRLKGRGIDMRAKADLNLSKISEHLSKIANKGKMTVEQSPGRTEIRQIYTPT